MHMIRKAFTSLGGILLAALLIAALAPKATRAIAAALVQVANTTANPVPVSDVAPTQPFQSECTVANSDTGSISDQCSILIPSGKRLVVQTVGMEVVSAPSARVLFGRFLPGTSGFPAEFDVVVPLTGPTPSENISEMSQELRLYADQQIQCQVVFSQPTGDNLSCSVAGYLVDIP